MSGKEQFKIPERYDCRNIIGFKEQIEHFVNKGQFHFMLMGNVGCGKTYITQIITKYLKKFIYYDSREIYKEYLYLLDSEYLDKNAAIKQQLSIMKDENVVLDDIGAEKPGTEAAHAYISDMVDSRHKNIKSGKAKRTIFVTNLDSRKMKRLYGERTVDRIAEAFLILKFGDHSFRADKTNVLKAGDTSTTVNDNIFDFEDTIDDEAKIIEDLKELDYGPKLSKQMIKNWGIDKVREAIDKAGNYAWSYLKGDYLEMEDGDEMMDMTKESLMKGVKELGTAWREQPKKPQKPKKYTREELEGDGKIVEVEADPELEEEAEDCPF